MKNLRTILVVCSIGIATALTVASPAAATPTHNAVPPTAPRSPAVSPSQFIAYSGPFFQEPHEIIDRCGPSQIHYHGSYQWYGRGQDGRMFNNSDTSGPANWVLHSDQNAAQLTGFGWQSMIIVC